MNYDLRLFNVGGARMNPITGEEQQTETWQGRRKPKLLKHQTQNVTIASQNHECQFQIKKTKPNYITLKAINRSKTEIDEME